jgi:hypothetical protein
MRQLSEGCYAACAIQLPWITEFHPRLTRARAASSLMSAPEAERAPSLLPCTALPISARAPETATEEIPIAAFLLVDQVTCTDIRWPVLEYNVMHGRFSEYKVLDRPLYAYCGIRDACRRPGGSIADALNVRGLVGQLEPLEQPTADR